MTQIECLRVLRDGEPRHVVVVGTGIAGLTAGVLLQKAEQLILEARYRLDGRIDTCLLRAEIPADVRR